MEESKLDILIVEDRPFYIDHPVKGELEHPERRFYYGWYTKIKSNSSEEGYRHPEAERILEQRLMDGGILSKVQIAYSAEEGLALLRQRPFSVIITDVELPLRIEQYDCTKSFCLKDMIDNPQYAKVPILKLISEAKDKGWIEGMLPAEGCTDGSCTTNNPLLELIDLSFKEYLISQITTIESDNSKEGVITLRRRGRKAIWRKENNSGEGDAYRANGAEIISELESQRLRYGIYSGGHFRDSLKYLAEREGNNSDRNAELQELEVQVRNGSDPSLQTSHLNIVERPSHLLMASYQKCYLPAILALIQRGYVNQLREEER